MTTDIGLWRVNYFRAAREMAVDFGGAEASTAAGGWAATFASMLEALLCAQSLTALVGWHTDGASLSAGLSGGLSAGEVTREPLVISGRPVREAIAAVPSRPRPRQVLSAEWASP